MNVIIAGSRSIKGARGMRLVEQAVIDSGFTITRVFSGMAKGIDQLGVKWARAHDVRWTGYPAQWYTLEGEYRPHGGFERNERMADDADALIAIWDGFSPGTKHMIQCMGNRAKPTYYIDLDL
jgi:hypothetical protein